MHHHDHPGEEPRRRDAAQAGEPCASTWARHSRRAVSMPMSGLLMDTVKGNLTLFMRRDELDAAWAWIDPIRAGWEAHDEGPKTYIAGTLGTRLLQRHAESRWVCVAWRTLTPRPRSSPTTMRCRARSALNWRRVSRPRLAARGLASLVVSGGKSPIKLFERLRAEDLDWSLVCVALADERWVEPSEPGQQRKAGARCAPARIRGRGALLGLEKCRSHARFGCGVGVGNLCAGTASLRCGGSRHGR